MARSREEIVSEMVDSGLFSDDEIRQAVKQSQLQPTPSMSPTAQYTEPRGRNATMAQVERSLPMLGAMGMGAMAGPALLPAAGLAAAGGIAGKSAQMLMQTARTGEAPTSPVREALKSGAMEGGGALLGGAAFKAAGAGLRAIAPPLKRLATGAISTISPASYEAVSARMANPQAVKTAMTREQLGNSVVASANKLSDQIRTLDDAARATLSQEPSIPKAPLLQKLAEIKRRYVGSSGKAVSGEAKGALSEIDNAIEGIKEIGKSPVERVSMSGPLPERVVSIEPSPNISEVQIKDVMSQYKNINWDDPAGGAKKEVRKLLDSTLKHGNENYRAAMKPVSDRTKLQAIVNKKLALKYDPVEGTYATDATSGKWIPSLLEGKKPETSQALKRLGAVTENDLLAKAKLTNFREQFEGGKTQGSRMVQLGRHVAGVPGAIAGATIDKMGGNISGKVVDLIAGIPGFPSIPENAQTAIAIALANALRRRKEKSNASR